VNVFEVLSMNERIIVWSDVSERAVITWNQSATLQVWRVDPVDSDAWDEIDVVTLGNPPASLDAARDAARKWWLEGFGNDGG